ncbi:serine hydrolase domain-containing protein [Cupriavidus basilensis]
MLGQLLADRYGKPWDVLVRENITGPLGMRSTFQFPGPQAKALAAGYSHEETRAPWDFDALSGAGALRSTAPDLLIFARAMMAGSAGPLGPAADRALTPLARYRGEEIGYAVLIRGPAGHRTYYHDGLTGGYRALLAFAPDTQEAAAVLVSNTHAPSYKVLLGITASRYPTMPAAPALAPGVLAEYGGIYQVDKSNYVTMVPQDGTLYRRTTGGGSARYRRPGATPLSTPRSACNMGSGAKPGRSSGWTIRKAAPAIPRCARKRPRRRLPSRRSTGNRNTLAAIVASG